MNPHSSQYHYAPPVSQMIIEGMQEIIGRPGVCAVFNLANLTSLSLPNRMEDFREDLSFDKISAIQTALEKIYGARSGRGMVLRSGRAAFKFLQQQSSNILGLALLEYRLLPTQTRIKKGLEAIAKLLSGPETGQIQVLEDSQAWIWHVEKCAWCWERNEQANICHFTVGMLEEYSFWASAGKIYCIEEIECQASGSPACLFRIDKKALD